LKICPMSAQEAELQALSSACKISEGKRANIYTDSRYALGVAHDFGLIWKTRGFLTTAGTPVKHSSAIKELMDALLLPEEDGIYYNNFKFCLPKNLYPAVVQWAHGPAHLSKDLMAALIQKYYEAPGITTLITNFCRVCAICAKCNPGKPIKVPTKHLAKPMYPFQRIQIDHIQMPKSGPHEYALVIVDMFSGWPEAYPVANITAKTTAKRLLTDVVCRFGLPEVIESDQGPAFTATVTKEIWTALGVTLAFHTPYHPQSSGKVERMNGTLKARMLKMSQETKMPWPESLPIALFSVRHTPRGKSRFGYRLNS
ncbi:hypothetical protein XELAEV_18029151mg, partial [Pelobates cultripes]